MRAIPVAYFTEERTIALSVENSLYNDIVKLTGDKFLANDFIQAHKGSVDFRREVRKNDKLAIIMNANIVWVRTLAHLILKRPF